MGLIQSGEQARLKERLRVSETMAIQLSALVQQGDVDGIQYLASNLLGHMQGLETIGIRAAKDDKLLFASGNHPESWTKDTIQEGQKRVEVPIYDAGELWGRLEITWSGDVRKSLFDLPDMAALAIFVAMSSLFCFVLYMRKTLRAVDPSAVVPDRVRSMLDTLTEGAVLIDNNNQIVLANLAFAALVGESDAPALTGKLLDDFGWTTETGEKCTSPPWHAVSNGLVQRGSTVRHGGGEKPRVLVVNATPILGENKSVRGALVTLDDITDVESQRDRLELTVRQLNEAQDRVKKQNDELQWLATRDGLTGCLNRRAFQEQLKTLFEHARRYKHPLSLVMLDIDHFKSINDTHGHAKGDEVLREISKRLHACVRASDVVARYGGEEFCLLLPNTELDGAKTVAEHVRLTIADTPVATLRVTSSFGVSAMTLLGEDAVDATLVNQADEALYLSKHNGRNRVSDFSQVTTPGQLPKKQKPVEAAKQVGSHPQDVAADNNSALSGLVSALQYRDPGTCAHSKRVAKYCVAVLEKHVSPTDLRMMEAAALLHDIGKIGVPDAILLKPGPLTDDEWDVMEQHDRIGTEIIDSAFDSSELTLIVRNHHAYFDGQDPAFGEFKGLVIPLRSRLLSICDAYDAMTSDRPYRKALSNQIAFSELRKHAGTQFDPQLVEMFISSIDESATRGLDLMTSVAHIRKGIYAERVRDAIHRKEARRLRTAASELRQTIRDESLQQLADAVVNASEDTQALEAGQSLLTALYQPIETTEQPAMKLAA
jgi:diguanylate cyclase (GGDEF)-like protein/putative nucleotidyltransferase with HDIG domain